jgi:hypothetical protein
VNLGHFDPEGAEVKLIRLGHKAGAVQSKLRAISERVGFDSGSDACLKQSGTGAPSCAAQARDLQCCPSSRLCRRRSKHRPANPLRTLTTVIPRHRPVRKRIGAVAQPAATHPPTSKTEASSGPFELASAPGVTLRGDLCVPQSAGRHPAQLLLVPHAIAADDTSSQASKAEFDRACKAGTLVLALTPSPSPPGTDDMNAPILGPFYLLSLRAELLNRTLVGLRTDDVIRVMDYLAARPDVDAARITATGSEHMGLVLLHAALLDPRLNHIAIDHVLSSYSTLLAAPLPTGAPEDIVPGALLHYDLPDLVKALGSRVAETSPLPGTADLSQTSTPLDTLPKQ